MQYVLQNNCPRSYSDVTYKQHREGVKHKAKIRNNMISKFAGTSSGANGTSPQSSAIMLVNSVTEYSAPTSTTQKFLLFKDITEHLLKRPRSRNLIWKIETQLEPLSETWKESWRKSVVHNSFFDRKKKKFRLHVTKGILVNIKQS